MLLEGSTHACSVASPIARPLRARWHQTHSGSPCRGLHACGGSQSRRGLGARPPGVTSNSRRAVTAGVQRARLRYCNATHAPCVRAVSSEPEPAPARQDPLRLRRSPAHHPQRRPRPATCPSSRSPPPPSSRRGRARSRREWHAQRSVRIGGHRSGEEPELAKEERFL